MKKSGPLIMVAVVALLLLASLVYWRNRGSVAIAPGAVQPPVVAEQRADAATAQTGSPPAAPAAVPAIPAPAPAPDQLAAFDAWAGVYLSAATPEAKAKLMGEGEVLAKARREEMARLIKSDPEHALQMSVPYKVRKELPENVSSLLEKPVNGRGDYKVIYFTPLPGRESEVPPTERQVILNHQTYDAFVYGRRLQQGSQPGISINGIAIDKTMALSADPVRILAPEEAADVLASKPAKAQAPCVVCGQTPAAGSEPVLAQIGGKPLPVCQLAEVAMLNVQLSAAESSLPAQGPRKTKSALKAAAQLAPGGGGNGSANAVTNLPPASGSPSEGRKRLILMPVLFFDDPTPPASIDSIYSVAENNNRYYVEGSYGIASFDTTVTPYIRVPETKAFYGEFLGSLLPDAATVAFSMGYDIGFYDFTYILFTSIPGVTFGGRSDGLLVGGGGAVSHELGHNFGLAHANFWETRGNRPLPKQPAAPAPPYPIDQDSLIGHDDINAPAVSPGAGKSPPDEEYGDIFDVMGSGSGHFSTYAKWLLKWLPDQFTHVISTSETNRLYAFDTPSITPGRLYALRIQKDFERVYWASYRQGIAGNPWLASGIELTWAAWSGTDGSEQLLDTTPGTSAGKNDAPVVIGRTYADPQNSMYLTPVAKGGVLPGDKWIDVVVQLGPFPTNLPPTLTLSADQLTVTNGATVNFTATASDPNGDTLAYYWDFSDQTFGVNSPTVSHTFSNDGQFVVRCEVSDMRGGLVSAYVVVVVGNPTTFTMSGQVTDIYGNPVQGVRVHNSGTIPPYTAPDPYNPPPPPTNGSYRYSFTDSQGNYTIGNIPPGNYTNRAFIYGYITQPTVYDDPVVLTAGDAIGLDHLATPLPVVSIAAVAAAHEATPPGLGGFTLTRTGDTSQDLPIRFAVNGTAIAGTDYLPLAGTIATNGTGTNTMVTTNTIGNFVIKAGVSSTNLIVTPIDDSNGTGPKTVELTLLLATNDFRISSFLTNIISTNVVGTMTNTVTNTVVMYLTNTVTIPGWELLPVGPNNDLTWFQTYPTYVLGIADKSVTIFDNDPPALPTVSVFSVGGFALRNAPGADPDSDAVETVNDSATATFIRLGGSVESNLVVNYTISGTASNGADYVALSGTAVIPAGQRFVNVPIVAINDYFVEGNETVVLKITANPSAYKVGGGTAGFLIIDDDLPLISIYSTDSTALKTGSTGTLTIEREGDLSKDLLVNYLLTGTAISGVDYQALPGSITIPAGQITVTIVVKPIFSPNPGSKLVTAVLSDSTTYNISSLNNQANVTIYDDLPRVTIAATTATVVENAGPAVFTLTRTGPATNSLVVYYQVGGLALNGLDYAAISTNVTFAAGSNTAVINIVPVNDVFNELGDVNGDDKVVIQLEPGPGYLLGNNTSATVTISNDDGNDLPAVGFILRESSGREDSGVAELAVRITANPKTNQQPVLIDYKISAGTAVQGVNYVFTNGTGTLSFVHYTPPPAAPGPGVTIEGSITNIPIPLLNDGVPAGNKTFTVTLFTHVGYVTNLTTNMMTMVISTNLTPAPTNGYVGDYRSHTFTIIDVGTTVVSIAASTPLAFEEGSTPGVFTITRNGPNNAPLTVNFDVSGTAASGSDYLPLGRSVTIPAGTNAVQLLVLPNDDPTEEIPETVTVSLLAGPGFNIGVGQATIIIVDNDGTIQFTAANYTVNEGDEAIAIGVQRSGPTNTLVTVDYQVSDGTAISGLDYTAVNGTLTFNPGEVLKFFPVQIIDDLLVEPTETINLLLTNATGGIPLGGQKTAVLSIIDNDSAYVFSTNNFRVNENGTNALIGIYRIGVTNAAQTVIFWTTDGSATNGLDYRGTTNTLNFAGGETNKTVSVSIIDDALFEGNETVVLHVTNAISGNLAGGLDTSTLTIVDDECALEFASATYSVAENAGFVTVVVQRSGGTINPVSVQYQTVDGTALGSGTNTIDYVGQSGTLNFRGDAYLPSTNGNGAVQFQPGDTTQNIQIAIIDNQIGDGNRTFSVTLTNASGPPPPRSFTNSTIVGVPSNTVVTIIDNETPGNIDPPFNSGLGPNDRVRAIAVQADLSIVFGGDFTTVDGISYNRIGRWQANGNLDRGFNPGAGFNGMVDVVVMQPDTKILVGGAFTSDDSTNRANVARLNADGNLDLSFDPGAGPNNLVRAIAVQANGQVLIGGDFTQVGSLPRNHLARLNANGTLDANFSPVVNASVYTLGVQGDGKIVLGGAFTSIGPSNSPFVGRLNTNGAVDATFNAGSGPNDIVTSLAVQSDGNIVLGGRFTSVRGTNWNYVARLTSTGALDGSFNPGSGPNASVNSVAVHSSGKIILGGDFTFINGAGRSRFARLNADGTLDAVFNIGTGANATVRAVAVQPDSAVLIGGDFTQVEGVPRNYIARIHGEEKLDLSAVSFSATNYVVSESALFATITVIRTGNTNRAFNVFFGTSNGTATAFVDYTPTNGFLRFGTGDITKTFTIPIIDDGVIDANETVNLFLTSTNSTSKVVLGPNLTSVLTILDNKNAILFSSTNYTVNENATNALITLLRVGSTTGAVSITFSTTDGTALAGLHYVGVTNLVTFAIGETNKTVLVPIIDDGVRQGPLTVNLALGNPAGIQLGLSNAVLTIIDTDPGPGGVDPGFDVGLGPNNFVRSMALAPDGKILVGGGFTAFDNMNRHYIARLNTNGTLDLTFNPGSGADALVASLAALPDGRAVLAGAFTNLNGVTYNHLGRLLTNGAPDPDFLQTAGFNAAVNAVSMQANGRMAVGGDFSLPTHGIIQVLPSGSVDFTFASGVGADGPVHCVLTQTNGQVIVGGAFSSVNTFPCTRVARLNANGSVDGGFVSTAITNGSVYCLASQPDGKVIIGGDFYTTSSPNAVGLARLNRNGSLDASFNPGGGANAAVFALAVEPSGKILVGGSFTTFNNTNRNRYVRLRPDGSVDSAFDPGAGANSTVYSILLLPDSNFLIGGDFTAVNGAPHNKVARIRADDVDPLFTMILFSPGNPAQLTLQTQRGNTYILEASQDLINWNPVRTNTATGPTLQVVDPSPSPGVNRFYRARRL